MCFLPARLFEGKKHFLQDFTLIYPMVPNFTKNNNMLCKILPNSRTWTQYRPSPVTIQSRHFRDLLANII